MTRSFLSHPVGSPSSVGRPSRGPADPRDSETQCFHVDRFFAGRAVRARKISRNESPPRHRRRRRRPRRGLTRGPERETGTRACNKTRRPVFFNPSFSLSPILLLAPSTSVLSSALPCALLSPARRRRHTGINLYAVRVCTPLFLAVPRNLQETSRTFRRLAPRLDSRDRAGTTTAMAVWQG